MILLVVQSLVQTQGWKCPRDGPDLAVEENCAPIARIAFFSNSGKLDRRSFELDIPQCSCQWPSRQRVDVAGVGEAPRRRSVARDAVTEIADAIDSLHCVGVTIPGKDGLIVRVLDNFLLQTKEGFVALPVEKRHIDVEEPHQAVSLIFLASRCSLRSPVHPFRNADIALSVDNTR